MTMTPNERARELPAILRDIAAGRRNSAGDYWSITYCVEAADFIEAALAERGEAVVTDEMVERACKRYAFREDGAVFPDAYSEYEVLAERALMREFLTHVLTASPPAAVPCTCPSGDGSLRHPCPEHNAIPVDALRGLVAELRAKSDSAYCNYIRKMGEDVCLGWEAKVKRGDFTAQNLNGFTYAADSLGRHKALAETASEITALLDRKPQEGG